MVDKNDLKISTLLDMNEDLFLEMASLWTKESGLPYKIWIDSVGVDRKGEASKFPCIKVEVDEMLIPIRINDNPDIPENVRKKGVVDFPYIDVMKKYVAAYKEILLAHFYHKIDDADALDLLSTLKKAPEAREKLKAILNDEESLASMSIEEIMEEGGFSRETATAIYEAEHRINVTSWSSEEFDEWLGVLLNEGNHL